MTEVSAFRWRHSPRRSFADRDSARIVSDSPTPELSEGRTGRGLRPMRTGRDSTELFFSAFSDLQKRSSNAEQECGPRNSLAPLSDVPVREARGGYDPFREQERPASGVVTGPVRVVSH